MKTFAAACGLLICWAGQGPITHRDDADADCRVLPAEIRALDARRKWKNGSLEIETNYLLFDKQGKTTSEIRLRSFAAFDGDNVRLDSQKWNSPKEPPVRNLIVFDRGQLLQYTDEKPGGQPVAVSLDPIQPGQPRPFGAVDPRLLGIRPLEWANLYLGEPLDVFVGNPARSKCRVATDQIGGAQVERVEYQGVRTFNRLWIDVALDFSVLQVEVTEGEHQDRITTEYSLHSSSGLYLPAFYQFERSFEGRVLGRQTAQLTWLSMNAADPRKLFDPREYNIPVGVPVAVDGPNVFGMHTWNGKEAARVDDTRVRQLAGKIENKPAPAILAWILVGNAVLLAFLGLWRYRTVRKRVAD